MDYTAEDEVIIKEKWDDLLLSCTKICKNDEELRNEIEAKVREAMKTTKKE